MSEKSRKSCTFPPLLASGLLLSLACSGTAWAQNPNPQPVSPLDELNSEASEPDIELGGGRIGPNYKVGPEDVLYIEVFNVPELRSMVRVANDGTITLPLLGQVQAAGFTAQQLREELEQKFGDSYLENPQVTIFVKEFHAQPVSIIGAVERPGLYPLIGPRTLIEMLSMAGGVAKRSNEPAGRLVYVTRKGGFGDLKPVDGMRLLAPDKLEIDLKLLLFARQDTLNIELKPLDIVSVSKPDVVYVMGRGVEKPGGYVLEDRPNVTVIQALAMAEGLTANAAGADAKIIRTQPDGSRIWIPVDVKKVLKGRSPDPVLAANDILFVPDSAQRAGLKRSVEAAIGTLSGFIIFHR